MIEDRDYLHSQRLAAEKRMTARGGEAQYAQPRIHIPGYLR